MFNDKKIFSKYPLILGGPKWLNFKFKIRVEFKKLPKKKKKPLKLFKIATNFKFTLHQRRTQEGPSPPSLMKKKILLVMFFIFVVGPHFSKTLATSPPISLANTTHFATT